MKVDAASRRVQFIESSDVFHAAGRRVYLKALSSRQLLMGHMAHPEMYEKAVKGLTSNVKGLES